MGQEINRCEFSEDDRKHFGERLDDETRQLEACFRDDRFGHASGTCGLEMEGWLVDGNADPAPENEAFLEALDNPLVVPELSRFNFEINTTPQVPAPRMFRSMHEQLHETWSTCERTARTLGLFPLHIGTLPTLRDDAMTLANMSPMQRYYALNQQVLQKRQGSPLAIDIKGNQDHLHVEHWDVMTEAATTSLQIHLQLENSSAVRFYNAAHILSAPMVALCANSPYLFGHELWEESRIPLFEQAVAVPAFYDREAHLIERVTFGTGYCTDSMMEVFRENRDSFPPLLPLLYPEGNHQLEHLRLHNGTIWRWNRPLVDFDGAGNATLRLEHRVAPAGPSLPDSIANIVFFYGLIHYLAELDDAPEHRLGFGPAAANFYRAARKGMGATVFWLDGHEYGLRELLLEELIPATDRTLRKLGIAGEDIQAYLHNIIGERVRTGQTGAAWQRGYIARYGRDFRAMTQAYQRNQSRQIPVHQWIL